MQFPEICACIFLVTVNRLNEIPLAFREEGTLLKIREINMEGSL